MSRFVLYAPDYASVDVIRCSPPSLMVHVALEEKAADYQVCWLDFAKGEHKSESMRSLNPHGTLPVLVEAEVVITETLAMLEYVEHRCAHPPLLPADPAARALALSRWREAAKVKDAGMGLFRRLMRGRASDPERAALFAQLQCWEDYLTGHAWLSGDTFGMADLCVLAYVSVAARVGFELASLPRLDALREQFEARDSVRAAWPKTWLR